MWRPRIWVGENKENGFWQKLEYEGNIAFCTKCRLLGHVVGVCRKGQPTPQTKNADKQPMKPKTRVEYRPKKHGEGEQRNMEVKRSDTTEGKDQHPSIPGNKLDNNSQNNPIDENTTKEINKRLEDIGLIGDTPEGLNNRNNSTKKTPTSTKDKSIKSVEKGHQERGLSNIAPNSSQSLQQTKDDRMKHNSLIKPTHEDVQMQNRFTILQDEQVTEDIQSEYEELNERGTDHLCVSDSEERLITNMPKCQYTRWPAAPTDRVTRSLASTLDNSPSF